MQTIKQLADELGVSKQAVHKKIEKLGIKNELQTVNRTLMIDVNHANAIRRAFFTEKETNVRQPNDNIVNQLTSTAQTQMQTMTNGFLDSESRQPVDELSSTNRQAVDVNRSNIDVDRVCIVNQPKTYSEDYVLQLLARIEGLEADKVDLKAEKLLMQKQIEEKDAHIMEISERLTVLLKNEQDKMALTAADDVKTEKAEPEKKKPWWKFW